MAKLYNKTPAEILFIEEEYAAYCLNEACAFITYKIRNGESISFVKHYGKFSDLYKNYK